MDNSEVDQFSNKVAGLKANGLKDLKFYPGITNETVPDQFCEEANRLLDGVIQGKGTILDFDDCKLK